jgi:hypothetical protein
MSRGTPIMRRSLLLLAGLAGLPSLGGCSPYEPSDARPIDPPAGFVTWWQKTEDCSGRTGDFQRVRWFVVPGDMFECPGGECVGHWQDPHHIYISEAWIDNELVVRHEMLHDLLGRPGHPNPPFGQGCPLTWATWGGPGSALRQGGVTIRID